MKKEKKEEEDKGKDRGVLVRLLRPRFFALLHVSCRVASLLY